MDVALFFRTLFRHKILLVLGVLVSLGVALYTGFTLEKGTLEPRAAQDYSASTTIMLGSANPQQSVFSSELPPRPLVEGQTPGDTRNLAGMAVIYAYLVGSDEIRALVEQQIGPLSEHESLSAIQRTTQPDGNERFPGDFELPIIDVMGSAHSAERAEEIATAGAQVFQAYAIGQQDAAAVAPTARVTFTPLRTQEAEVLEGSSPLLPIVAVGFGVFLAFVVLILIVDNIRRGRARSRAERAEAAQHEQGLPERDAEPLPEGGVRPEPVVTGRTGAEQRAVLDREFTH